MADKESENGSNEAKNEVWKVKDIGEMSQYELFHFYKIMGSLNPGAKGLEFLRSARGTGEAILMALRDDAGRRIFGNDMTLKDQESFILEDKVSHVINIAYYVGKIINGPDVYETVKATFSGTMSNKKRIIKMTGFESEQEGGDSVEDIRMAEERAWSIASGKMNDILGWLESQMAAYGLVKSPLVPISIVARCDQWDKNIVADEYWHSLMEQELAMEKEKVRKTMEAEKPAGG